MILFLFVLIGVGEVDRGSQREEVGVKGGGVEEGRSRLLFWGCCCCYLGEEGRVEVIREGQW